MKTKINFGDCILSHYEKHMGTPVSRDTFSRTDDSRKIQIFGYDRFFKDAIVLASFGLSKFAVELNRGHNEIVLDDMRMLNKGIYIVSIAIGGEQTLQRVVKY